MSKLYPIGTQLITRRLSQAALAHELGFSVDSMRSFEPEDEFSDIFLIGTDNFDIPWDTWRVTVTAENQKWLSPVPMVGDLVIFHGESNRVPYPQFWKEHNIYDGTQTVEKRTYPNNQRAPMIEWYEVIEPEMEGRK